MANTTQQSTTIEETNVPTGTTDDDQAAHASEQLDDQDEHPVADIPLDLTFEILKNQRRRLVLDFLRNVEDNTTTIGDLAEHIAAIENDCDIQALGAQQRKRVYIGLYQCHLPKMDDAGVLDFNQSRGFVELRPEAEPLFEYLVDADEEIEDDEASTESADPMMLAAATVGIGLLFGLTQLMGLYLLASVLVFAFLGYTLYLNRDGVAAAFASPSDSEE